MSVFIKTKLLLLSLCLTMAFLLPSARAESSDSIKPLGLVVLLTDFGTADGYVGAMKGAIYATFPGARIDDITHDVPQFDVEAGSRALAASAVEYPEGTVFVAVVDPGVATDRKAIVLQTQSGHYFVAPDNGILQGVTELLGRVAVREIKNPAIVKEGALASTFQGRDLFGPAAAHLANGFSFDEIGPIVEKPVALPPGPKAPVPLNALALRGAIRNVDGYGNVITNITRVLVEQMGWKEGDRFTIHFGKEKLEVALMRAYAEVPEGSALAVINSDGWLEFAVNRGNLAARISVKRGDTIKVVKEKP